jgi:hypothetical protein
VVLNPALPSWKMLTFVFLLAMLLTSRPSKKHCSARRVCAANAVGKDLDIFTAGAVSLNHIHTHQRKIVNNICSQF